MEVVLALVGVLISGLLVALLVRLGRPSVVSANAEAGQALQAELAERRGAVEAELAAARARLDAAEERLAAQAHRLEEREAGFAAREAALAQAEAAQQAELARRAGLSAEQARAELLAQVEQQAKRDAALIIRDREDEARATAEVRAREIVGLAIQRVASEQTTESVVTVIHLPGDDMKGRIIGREGRNIRTFESVTGVNLLIDDSPETVLLSCFDPVRREIGRLTLETLIADGRIHPQRIEETFARAQAEVDDTIRKAGEDAIVQAGLTDVHPELVTLLGKLKYRTSYGQNVLKHLIETAHIAGGIAGELGLPHEGVTVVKRGAFLHDIGKALTHEVEGSHALIGADLARKYGESKDVVHAIEAHHEEVPPRTLEAWLTIASDSCSGGRPGARRDQLEHYVSRLSRIEEIAREHEGVEKVYAMSAGREVRVMVVPDVVDDLGAQVLARDIAQQIEKELTYPGQIRVTVVRESRATETAH